MKLYNTRKGILLEDEQGFHLLEPDWDLLVNQADLYSYLREPDDRKTTVPTEVANDMLDHFLLAPVGSQELWAAGVTYLRSRDARMEESKDAGGGDFYQKVYEADRPELFFKALPHRISGSGKPVYIRRDSSWNVPEPELTLFINSAGEVQGYTIGNDMSSRSIEGENPLYLPQAKTYEKSAALGPCLYVPGKPLPSETGIRLEIFRKGMVMFNDSIKLERMKRSFAELAGWLFRECDFPSGCYLMTGTGIVPPDNFTLLVGDRVEITIDGIGTLANEVSVHP